MNVTGVPKRLAAMTAVVLTTVLIWVAPGVAQSIIREQGGEWSAAVIAAPSNTSARPSKSRRATKVRRTPSVLEIALTWPGAIIVPERKPRISEKTALSGPNEQPDHPADSTRVSTISKLVETSTVRAPRKASPFALRRREDNTTARHDFPIKQNGDLLAPASVATASTTLAAFSDTQSEKSDQLVEFGPPSPDPSQRRRLVAQAPAITPLPQRLDANEPSPETEPQKPRAQVTSTNGATVVASEKAASVVLEHDAQMTSWSAQVDAAAKTIADENASDSVLLNIPPAMDKLRSEVRPFLDSMKSSLDAARKRLEKLGPEPKSDDAPEFDDVTNKRSATTQEVAAYDGLIKQGDVLLVRANQLTEQSNTRRRDRFAERLLSPAHLYYTKALWTRAVQILPDQFSATATRLTVWLKGALARSPANTAMLFGIPFLVLGLVLLLRRGFWRANMLPVVPGTELTSTPRGHRALVASVRTSLPWLVALAVIYPVAGFAFGASADAQFALLRFLIPCAGAIILFTLARHACLVREREWRLIGRGGPGAKRIYAIFVALILVWLSDQLLTQAELLLTPPYPLTVLRTVIVAILYAALLFLLLLVPLANVTTETTTRYRGWPRWLFFVLAIVVMAIVIATMAGYVTLARFIGAQVVATGGVLFTMLLLHLSAEHVSAANISSERTAAEEAQSAGSPVGVLRVLTGLVLDMAILAVGVPLLLLQWGFDWTEVQGWLKAAFFGFQVGGLTISLQTVLTAMLLFGAGLVSTRIVQRWFTRRARLTGRLRNGVGDSIRMGLGYAGFIVSALLAFSFLGLSFANFAIVAGALSVGIGFGLQSIFNNFVSGLIMLVERPIKLGDWISVGSAQGYVRKINVRATEIETIDKQSVLVPNSEFISGAITNWMYDDRVGRLNIPVGVAYGSDVEKVRDILLGVAKDHSEVLNHPAPSVIFTSFGDSALNFNLRAYLRDVEMRLRVSSDLHFAITHAFAEQNIEIPFPQRDINIKGLDQIRETLAGTAPAEQPSEIVDFPGRTNVSSTE